MNCHEAGTSSFPQLLSPEQPAYDWSPSDNVVLRYEYEFMPKGLITRFIVALNHLIADQNKVWKSGVVLEREETKAEVIEDYPKAEDFDAGRRPRRAGIAGHCGWPARAHSSFLSAPEVREIPAL